MLVYVNFQHDIFNFCTQIIYYLAANSRIVLNLMSHCFLSLITDSAKHFRTISPSHGKYFLTAPRHFDSDFVLSFKMSFTEHFFFSLDIFNDFFFGHVCTNTARDQRRRLVNFPPVSFERLALPDRCI